MLHTKSRNDLWALVMLAAALCVVWLMSMGCSQPSVERLRQTLVLLDEHNIIYSGKLEMDLTPEVYAKQSFGLSGRALLRLDMSRAVIAAPSPATTLGNEDEP